MAAVEAAHDTSTPSGARQLLSKGVPFSNAYTAAVPPPHQEVSDTTFRYAFLRRFYRRLAGKDLSGAPPPDPPDFDFHTVLGALGDYPMLLRKFGLVIDLRVPYDSGMSSDAGIQVLPSAPWLDALNQPHEPLITPITRYLLNLNDGQFQARPRPAGSADLADGFLGLNNANHYRLIQTDVDGAALKNLNMAGNRYLQINGPINTSYATPDETSLPSVRETGLAVVKTDRAYQLGQDVQDNALMNTDVMGGSGSTVEFYAENWIRGYRADVFDEAKQQWYSLCRRIGRYRFQQNPATDIVYGANAEEDEGYLKVSSASSAPDDSTEDLYLHEALFQWDGWSVVAEHPGKPIVTPEHSNQIDGGDPKRYEQPGRVKQTPPAEFQLETFFVPKPGSLPLLRYGRAYRLRARSVDMAGNSVDPASTDTAHATAPHTFRRFDPVTAPTLQLRSVLTEGEAVERMVIRSNHDQTTNGYVNDPDVQQATSGYLYHLYTEDNERHAVPPKTSQFTAELHGVFDAAIGPGKDGTYDTYFQIAIKEKGTLMDPTTGLQLVDLGTNTVADFTGVDPGEPLIDPNKSFSGQRYLIHTEQQLVLPYLPDVLAKGAAFQGLPGYQGVWLESFNNQFATSPVAPVLAEPFRIRIDEGNAPPQFWANHPTAGTRVLEVYLPKATIATVRYSCSFDQADLNQMGMVDWLELDPQSPSSLRDDVILKGRHWMFTPWRELTLVHAVQQPLHEPEFKELNVVKRIIGDTFA